MLVRALDGSKSVVVGEVDLILNLGLVSLRLPLL